jgi:hypothetical protein
LERGINVSKVMVKFWADICSGLFEGTDVALPIKPPGLSPLLASA